MTILVFLSKNISNYQQICHSFNNNVVHFDYSSNDDLGELEIQINNLSNTSFDNLCFIFSEEKGDILFVSMDNFVFKHNDEVHFNQTNKFIKRLVEKFSIKNIDFLACNLLNKSDWQQYFQFLITNLNVSVRASDDNTGNLKNGGDWILETTNEDIKDLYFNENIEEWNGVLDHSNIINGFIAKNSSTQNVDYFTFGYNSMGETAVGPPKTTNVIQSTNLNDLTIKSSADWRDKKLAIGYYFSAMIDSNDDVYTWGSNNYYQLGTGNNKYSTTPQRVLRGSLIGKTFKRIECADRFTYVLSNDGKLYCWGSNQYSMGAGLATTTTPQLMTGGIFDGTIDDICAGYYAAACISNNKVYAWGWNASGHIPKLKDNGGLLVNTNWNNNVVYSTPVELEGITGTPVRLFSARNAFGCLTSDNNLYIWGYNESSRLGNGGIDGQLTKPILITISGKTITNFSSGVAYSLLLCSDGTVYGLGSSSLNVLGNLSGTFTTPTQITNVSDITRVSSFLYNSLLVNSSGGLTSFGWNGDFQNNSATSWAATTGKSASYVVSGDRHGLILTTDNYIYGIGWNAYGELAFNGQSFGYNPNKVNPKDIAGQSEAGDVVEYGFGESFQMVRTSNGWVYGVANNDEGQLGKGTTGNSPVTYTFNRVGGNLLSKNVTKLSVGRNFNGAITSDGKCYMWGYNVYFNLGLSGSSSKNTPAELTISGETFVDVGCGYDFAIWVTASGKVYSTGNNTYGQLGLGNNTAASSVDFAPKEITYFTNNNIQITKVSCGQYFTIALSSTGNLYSWGINSPGVLGDNSVTNRNSPVAITTNISGKVFTKISTGTQHVLAITNTGELYSWGDNTNFRLMAGHANNKVPTQVPIPSGRTASHVFANSAQSYLVTTDNVIYFVGLNNYGQLGDYTLTSSPDYMVEYDLASNLTGYTAVNQSLTNNSLSVTNTIGANLVNSNVNSITATYPDFISASSGTITVSSISYASSVFNTYSIANSSLVPYTITQYSVSFSDYITLDFNFTWNSSVKVYFTTSTSITPTEILTTDNGSGAYYSKPNSTTVRLHTLNTGIVGLYNFIDVPSSPRNVSAVAGVASAVVSFTAPVSDGGSAITSYTVTSSPGNFVETGSSSPITISGLSNNTSYTFTVVANNAAGSSVSSSASSPKTTATTPGLPRNVTVTAYDSSALISFTAPLSNGGATITGYTVVSTPGNITTSGLASPILVKGLTNGTSYTFKVLAANGVGSGSYTGESAAVIPSLSTLSTVQTTSLTANVITAITNTTALSSIQKKTALNNLLNSDTSNRIVPTTVGKLSNVTAISRYTSNQIDNAAIVLLNSNDTTSGPEQTIIDISTEFNSNKVLYLPIKESESVKVQINGTVYTIQAISVDGEVTSLIVNDTTTITNINETYGSIRFSMIGGVGLESINKPLSSSGAGSDPYITSFCGHTFELPHLNKWWNLFTHKSSDLSIIAHTHNYSTGNFFNEIKIKYGNLKATIDYQKKKITSNNNMFKIGKTALSIKYNKNGKIKEEEKLYDCIVFNHPVFEEIVLLVNWKNDYFHPMFKVNPTNECSGLLMTKQPISISK